MKKQSIHEMTINHFGNQKKIFEALAIDYKTSKMPMNVVRTVLDEAKLKSNKDMTPQELDIISQINNLIFKLFIILAKRSRKGKVKMKFIIKNIDLIIRNIRQ